MGPDLLPENWTPPKTVFPSGTVVNAGVEAVTSYIISQSPDADGFWNEQSDRMNPHRGFA